MKKLLFKKNIESEEMSLQITSMADIFTILLVFLLKSYAAGVVNIAPAPGMKLPQAFAPDSQIEALKVEISQTTVQIEGRPVATLEDFRFKNEDLLSNGSSEVLVKALEHERQRELLIAKTNTDIKIDPKIIVIADQRVPYVTVKSVLASAALNGYTDFKLAVVKGD